MNMINKMHKIRRSSYSLNAVYTLTIFAAILGAIYLSWCMWTMDELGMFIDESTYTQSIPDLFTRSVVHIHQTKEIALEIAAKFASVNGS
jgi:hypothetical protein